MPDKPTPYQLQEKGKISILQFALLAITLVIATANLFSPAFIAREASRDAWISVILGTIFSLVVVNIFLTLGLKYPDKTLIQYSCDILGKPLGKFVGLMYVYFFVFMAWAVTRELGELYIVAFNPHANLTVYNTIIIAVAAYAVGKGLEVIARVNQILIPLGLGVLLLVAIVNLPVTDLRNFLPIMYEGINPSIRGAILIQTWMLETVIFLQCLPSIKQPKKIRTATNISLIILGLSFGIGVLIIAIFGPLTPKLLIPALQYVRIASIGPYVQHLDITFAGIWVTGIFVKVTILYYVSVLALSQLVEMKSYKPLVLPVGALLISFSVYAAKRITGIMHFLHFIFPFYCLTMALVIPSILLMVSALRHRNKTQK